MVNTKTLFVLLVGLMIPTSYSYAGALADKASKDSFDSGIKEGLASVNARCDSAITETADWSSWGKVTSDQMGGHSVSAMCDAGGVGQLCGDSPDGKAAVKSKIKKIVCAYGKQNVELKGDTLTMTVDFDSANVDDAVEKYLKNTL